MNYERWKWHGKRKQNCGVKYVLKWLILGLDFQWDTGIFVKIEIPFICSLKA